MPADTLSVCRGQCFTILKHPYIMKLTKSFSIFFTAACLCSACLTSLHAHPDSNTADSITHASSPTCTCDFSKTHLISPSHPAITYTGRIDFTSNERPRFTYPGIEIKMNFTGSSIAMKAKPHSGFFMAQIDDMQPVKIHFADNATYCISNTLSPNTPHTITITYIGEGYNTLPEFHGFLIDSNHTASPTYNISKHTIEFIGNSITCGYGIEAMNPTDPYKEETANYYYTYAAITSRELNARSHVIARSGIGVYRNYNGPRTGDAVNMNTEYPYTLLYNNTVPWDFTRFIPELVCINLGTNDTSTQGADTTLLLQGYMKLYHQVRSHYPKSSIAFLSGCMMTGQQLETAKQTMDKAAMLARAEGDEKVYRFDFTPQDGSLGYGASYHPSKEQHKKMADELIQWIKRTMGW